jgi:hypothetical protein
VEPVADDVQLGDNSIEVDGVEPQPGDVAGGLCWDLVVRGSTTSVSGCATPSDAVPALRFSSAVGPGAACLRLPGSLGSPSPPVSWGHVMNSTEQACSRVAATKRLLWEVMATISWDVLHIIWVSLKKK